MTLAAGIHEIDFETYINDPAPEPSLHASDIAALIDGVSLRRIAASNPRLGGERKERKRTAAMDLGNVVHAMTLGKGAQYEPLPDVSSFPTDKGTPSQTWGSKSAKQYLADVEARGMIGLDIEDYAKACAMTANLTELLAKTYGAWPNGQSEVMALWQRGGLWCRGLLDHFFRLGTVLRIIDIKSTALPLSDWEISKSIGLPNDIQAAFYSSGMATLFPECRDGIEFDFAVVESTPPHEARIATMPIDWIEACEPAIERAAEMFRAALTSNEWPGQEERATITCPPWRADRLFYFAERGAQ